MWSKYLFDLKHVWVAPGGGDCGKGGNLMWERCSCKYDLKFAIVCVLALWLCWNLKCEWLYGLLSDISWRSDWLCAVWWIDWGELRIFGLRCFFTGIHFFQMFKFVEISLILLWINMEVLQLDSMEVCIKFALSKFQSIFFCTIGPFDHYIAHILFTLKSKIKITLD